MANVKKMPNCILWTANQVPDGNKYKQERNICHQSTGLKGKNGKPIFSQQQDCTGANGSSHYCLGDLSTHDIGKEESV